MSVCNLRKEQRRTLQLGNNSKKKQNKKLPEMRLNSMEVCEAWNSSSKQKLKKNSNLLEKKS